MAIVWRQEMSTGLDWQDDQHRELLFRINILLDALENQTAPNVVKELLDFLGEYAMKHFHAEEKYMKEHNCSTCDRHRQCHAQFISTWTDLRALYASQGASTLVILRLQHWLRDWLIQHILNMDKEMVRTCDPD